MAGATTGVAKEEFVYRVSTDEEWEELQKTGATLGGDLDRRTGCIHLSDLRQVKMVLNNFYQGRKDLYLLRVDVAKFALCARDARVFSGAVYCTYYPITSLITKELGEGLIYEAVDESNSFPHFYGPSRSFSPLSIDAVTRAERLELVNEEFKCSLLDQA